MKGCTTYTNHTSWRSAAYRYPVTIQHKSHFQKTHLFYGHYLSVFGTLFIPDDLSFHSHSKQLSHPKDLAHLYIQTSYREQGKQQAHPHSDMKSRSGTHRNQAPGQSQTLFKNQSNAYYLFGQGLLSAPVLQTFPFFKS